MVEINKLRLSGIRITQYFETLSSPLYATKPKFWCIHKECNNFSPRTHFRLEMLLVCLFFNLVVCWIIILRSLAVIELNLCSRVGMQTLPFEMSTYGLRVIRNHGVMFAFHILNIPFGFNFLVCTRCTWLIIFNKKRIFRKEHQCTY